MDITVFQAPDLSKSVQVAEDGAINLPLVGQIPAAGKSASQLERDIEARLNARYLKSAQVTVFVKEYNSQRVTVEGAVRSPGVFPLRGNDTLMQVLAKSGGVNREVASDNVIVFRNADGARTMVRFDISAIRGGAEADPRVLPGDVVLVEEFGGQGNPEPVFEGVAGGGHRRHRGASPISSRKGEQDQGKGNITIWPKINGAKRPPKTAPRRAARSSRGAVYSPSSYPYREGGEPFTGASDADAGLDLRNILRVLIKRKWLIVAVTATFVCLGLVWALLQTPLYKATLRLQIDRSAPQIVKGAEPSPRRTATIMAQRSSCLRALVSRSGWRR